MTFFNVSNHPHNKWSEAQKAAALALTDGEIIDVPFPNVPPTASEEDVDKLADEITNKIGHGHVAMVQGEFSLTFKATTNLKNRGVTVVVATTERNSKETVQPDGTVKKETVFEFCRFRRVLP